MKRMATATLLAWLLMSGTAAAHGTHAPVGGGAVHLIDVLGGAVAGGVALGATLLIAGLLVASVLVGSARSRRSRLVRIAAAGIVATIGAVRVAGHPHWTSPGAVLPLIIAVLHLAAAAVWVGIIAYVLLSWSAVAARRMSRAALVSAGVTIATGVVNMRIHTPYGGDANTSYGHVLVVKVGLVALAAAAGAGARRYGRRLVAVEAVVMAGVVSAAAALVALPAPAFASPVGAPVVRQLRVGAASMAVVITPNRPGRNLIHVVGDAGNVEVAVDGAASQPLTTLAGTAGWSGVVVLQPGWRRLSLRLGQQMARLRVRVPNGAPATVAIDDPDSGECVSGEMGWVAGLALASRQSDGSRDRIMATRQPFDGCRSVTAASDQLNRTYASTLAKFGSNRVAVVTDGSPRARSLEEGLAAVGVTGHEQSSADAVVLATGWFGAQRYLQEQHVVPTRGVFLAPWLLDGAFLQRGASSPQLTVGSTIDPNSAVADSYLQALQRVLPGEWPSSAGFDAFVAGRSGDTRASAGVALYTPVQIEFLPPSLSDGHSDHHPTTWAGGQRLVAITSPVDVPR